MVVPPYCAADAPYKNGGRFLMIFSCARAISQLSRMIKKDRIDFSPPSVSLAA